MTALVDVPPFRAASLPEDTLFAGYGAPQPPPVVRREACACGGLLELRMGGDVAELVTSHNQTERHEAWSAQTRVL